MVCSSGCMGSGCQRPPENTRASAAAASTSAKHVSYASSACGSGISRAFEPGDDSPLEQRHPERRAGSGDDAVTLELVAVTAGPGAYRMRHVDQGRTRNADPERAAGRDELAGIRPLVDDDRDAGRRELDAHGPGRRHDVAPAAVLAGDKHRRPVVDQAAGVLRFDSSEMLHGSFATMEPGARSLALHRGDARR